MSLTYFDASAAMKILVEEAESAALREHLERTADDDLAASWLLHTELHCAAGRHPDRISRAAVTSLLEAVDLVELTRGDLVAAGMHAPLRAGDAVHLAVAVRIGADALLTYDDELAAAAAAAGLDVRAPRSSAASPTRRSSASSSTGKPPR